MIKRIFICMLTAILLIASCSISIFAEETYDSIKITSEEKQLLPAESGDTIVKLYSGVFMKKFSQKDTIDTIISGSNITSEKYIVKSNTKTKYYRSYDGVIGEITQIRESHKWNDFVKYALSTVKVFDASISVENIYCLDGAPSNDGVYIYYVTNRGDYVLYKDYLTSSEEYLFPISDFYDFAKAVCDNRAANKGKKGGATPIDEVFDIKPYKLHPYSGIIVVTIIVGVLAVGGVILFKIKRKSKKTQS